MKFILIFKLLSYLIGMPPAPLPPPKKKKDNRKSIN